MSRTINIALAGALAVTGFTMVAPSTASAGCFAIGPMSVCDNDRAPRHQRYKSKRYYSQNRNYDYRDYDQYNGSSYYGAPVYGRRHSNGQRYDNGGGWDRPGVDNYLPYVPNSAGADSGYKP